MSIEKKCADCSVIIVDEWFFACNGYMCSKTLSYSCAAKDAKKLLNKFPNDVRKAIKVIMDGVQGLRWFCSDCSDSLNQSQSKIDSALKRIEQTEDKLFNAIQTLTNSNKIMERIEVAENGQINETSSKPLPNKTADERRITRSQSKAATQVERTHPMTELRLNSDINHTPMTTLSPMEKLPNSTQVSSNAATSSHPEIGANESSEKIIPKVALDCAASELKTNVCDLTESTENYSFRVTHPRRWLFVSRIHNSVPDEQVRKLLTKIVNTEDLYMQRIVPRGSRGMTYDYVSYKINIPGEIFQNAINSTLWPAGLLVKEFDRSQKKVFFQPPHIRQQFR